ncbi:hypothetical protein [Nocardioides yefusunii]|uniref:Peptidase inhibitor family I36 n=1 Tax=Nocardioides yefusunii TaxID=2500546 RepID=A0ABW1R326_9ACTN|nr:hypothetical protein [Nocardioides yefusunii]
MSHKKITAAVGVALGMLAIAGVPQSAHALSGNQTLHPDTGASGTSLNIGTIWQNANQGGYWIKFKGGAQCTASYANLDYTERSLAEEDFDNRASSIADYNSCDTALFQYANFLGDRSGGADGWFDAGDSGNYNLSAWNDKASSIQWT